MYDLITVGTASVDLYFKGESLTNNNEQFELACGGKYFVDFFHEGLGGGATNVSIGVKKNGLKVALMAKIGNNSFKKLILDELAEHDISTHLCQFEDDYHNVSTILLNEKGEKTVINYRTPHQHYIKGEEELEHLSKAKAIYVANLPDASLSERMKIFNYLDKRDIHCFLNLGVNDCRRPKEQLESLLNRVDVLIINEHEFADLVKKSLHEIEFNKKSAYHYFPMLQNKVVVVTLGEKGSVGYKGDDIYFQQAIPPHKIVDTTGAGDGYTAAFIAEFLKTNGNIQSSMREGAEYSSKKLGHLGAN